MPSSDLDLAWAARARVARQRLAGATHSSVLDCVRSLGAVQSQDYPLACWSVGHRTADVTSADLQRAVGSGTILRTHILRPTWHFVAADDLRWMLTLSAPLVRARLIPYDSRGGLTPKTVARGVSAVARLFEDGRHRTRDQVMADLAAQRIPGLSAWALGHVLMHSELDAIICSGAPAGSRQTYAPFSSRVPAGPSLSRDEAVVELARRYFTSHAPATLRDFRWWSGLSAADARRALAALPDLQPVRVGDLELLAWRDDEDETASGPRAHLLQPFDELVVAYTESRHVVDTKGLLREKKADGLLSRTVLVDGQVAGRWRRDVGRAGIEVSIALAVRSTRRIVADIEEAAGRYAAFVERPLASFTVAPR